MVFHLAYVAVSCPLLLMCITLSFIKAKILGEDIRIAGVRDFIYGCSANQESKKFVWPDKPYSVSKYKAYT